MQHLPDSPPANRGAAQSLARISAKSAARTDPHRDCPCSSRWPSKSAITLNVVRPWNARQGSSRTTFAPNSAARHSRLRKQCCNTSLQQCNRAILKRKDPGDGSAAEARQPKLCHASDSDSRRAAPSVIPRRRQRRARLLRGWPANLNGAIKRSSDSFEGHAKFDDDVDA